MLVAVRSPRCRFSGTKTEHHSGPKLIQRYPRDRIIANSNGSSRHKLKYLDCDHNVTVCKKYVNLVAHRRPVTDLWKFLHGANTNLCFFLCVVSGSHLPQVDISSKPWSTAMVTRMSTSTVSVDPLS